MSRGKTPAPAYGLNYFANYDPYRQGAMPAKSWRGAWFEWGLRNTSQMAYLDETRGAWAFIAGATLAAGEDPTKLPDNQAWLGQHAAGGLRWFWIDVYRFAALRYPDELLSAQTIEAQGLELGQWVERIFGQLADHPPPA